MKNSEFHPVGWSCFIRSLVAIRASAGSNGDGICGFFFFF